MPSRAPFALRPGSGVAVVAPAGPPPPQAYEQGLELLARRYRIVRRHAPGAARLPYLAGDDEERAGALNEALRDPAVEAIICARGGYGCSRLLDLLDGEALVRRRLPLVGFSDCTVLHAWAAGLGVPSIHGPVVIQLPRLPASDLQGLYDLLEGRAPPRLEGLERGTPGRAGGALAGGNLSLLCHLLGTPQLPPLAGRILLLEEVGERPYRIDRMLTQLRRSGALDQVAGVVIGQLQGCDAPDQAGGLTAREVVLERLGDLGTPLALGAPVGHGDRNVALPLGLEAVLDADAGSLSFA